MTPALFAQIENDAFLKGTYNLQGIHFLQAVTYFKEFILAEERKGTLTPEFKILLTDILYLEDICKQLDSSSSLPLEEKINNLAQKIAGDLLNLPIDGSLLLPAGRVGHQMLCRVKRLADGFQLLVINTGDGIHYHAIKSTPQYTLYNFTKTWIFPLPSTTQEKNEAVQFIIRLLTAYKLKNSVASIDDLYKQTLSSICFLGGKEIHDLDVPDYFYILSQFSGSCTLRCLHQLPKIVANSLPDALRFILKFKLHALKDFSEPYLKQQQPLSDGIKQQINLAIENNLKILNLLTTPAAAELPDQLHYLLTVQQEINQLSTRSTPLLPLPVIPPSFGVEKTFTAPTTVAKCSSYHDELLRDNPFITNANNPLLDNLQRFIKQLKDYQEPFNQYLSLEQWLISMPTDFGPYFKAKLTTLAEYQQLQLALSQLQELLLHLRNSLSTTNYLHKMNIMHLRLLHMQIYAYDLITEFQKLPSFAPFNRLMMNSLVANQVRNPYWATNQPQFDQWITFIQMTYRDSPNKFISDFIRFFKQLMNTESILEKALVSLYYSSHSWVNDELHRIIKELNLEALFMLTEHIKGNLTLDEKFNPLLNKIITHLCYEQQLAQVIKVFIPCYKTEDTIFLQLKIYLGNILIESPLRVTGIPWYELAVNLSQEKYPMGNSVANKVLQQDYSNASHYKTPIPLYNSNTIQLQTETSFKQTLNANDLKTRDYYHLRSKPALQICLTLDYFFSHLSMLTQQDDQLYVEANLFQPGLLLAEAQKATFSGQFDRFLTAGLRFFNQQGKLTHESLFFIRLDYLVSSYLAKANHDLGVNRLANLQKTLTIAVQSTSNPTMLYALNQYLFLTLVSRNLSPKNESPGIETMSVDDVRSAYQAMFYLLRHDKPSILEENTHQFHVLYAMALFRQLLIRYDKSQLNAIINEVLLNETLTVANANDTFPLYEVTDNKKQSARVFNALLGQFFTQDFAEVVTPSHIQSHPLIKQLEINPSPMCRISQNGESIYLNNDEVYLQWTKDTFLINKKWSIHGKAEDFQLKPLTTEHLAADFYQGRYIARITLPRILLNSRMNCWQHLRKDQYLLVQNNSPCYLINDAKDIQQLNEQGYWTGFTLVADTPWSRKLYPFEPYDFLVQTQDKKKYQIKLPRFGLQFAVDADEGKLFLDQPATGEEVLQDTFPIHPLVPGLVLFKADHTRYLVPIQRMVALSENIPKDIEDSDFYPIAHDRQGAIVNTFLKQNPNKELLWHYDQSEHYISFTSEDNELQAETVGDTLYLAYLYLATHQYEKAWQRLHACSTRFAGLTGEPEELRYIAWICEDLPHQLDDSTVKSKRGKTLSAPTQITPPSVACQLKALSLLSHFLNLNEKWPLKKPEQAYSTANQYYLFKEHEHLTLFLNNLSVTVFNLYTRYHAMRCHLEGYYHLADIEKKHLLDYYFDDKEKRPRIGSLGYEWMCLHLESFTAALQSLSLEARRQHYIQYCQQLNPVMAWSSELKPIAAHLNLPLTSAINPANLKPSTMQDFTAWSTKFPPLAPKEEEIEPAIATLSSSISEDNFVGNFPIYFHVAWSQSPEEYFTVLKRFCINILTCHRSQEWHIQEAPLPFLCAILYRIMHHPVSVSTKNLTSFASLVKASASWNVPPLMVDTLVETNHHVLATPLQMMEKVWQKLDAPETITLEPVSQAHPCLALATQINAQPEWQSVLDEFKKIKGRFDDKKAALLSQHDAEEHVGALQYQAEKEQHQCLQALLDKPFVFDELFSLVPSLIADLELKTAKQWADALELANQGPQDATLARTWLIEKAAKSRADLNLKDLKTLYSRANRREISERTQLNDEQINILVKEIHQALINEIQLATTKRVNSLLHQAYFSNDTHDLLSAVALLTTEYIPGGANPTLVLFQAEEKIILKPRQIQVLNHLSSPGEGAHSFAEIVEQIPPGGGKTKVVTPLVVEKKARGDNLVVVEESPQLVGTNYIDLNSTSQRLFGKTAYPFSFNRQTHISAHDLKRFYFYFLEVISSKSYLVTTGESIQSLGLKYQELLLYKGEKTTEWQEQLHWLEKIFNLPMDGLIDEVHEGLWTKKKLIYALETSQTIKPALIHNAIALWNFIDPQWIIHAPKQTIEEHWLNFTSHIATSLITSPHSPLYSFVEQATQQYGQSIQHQLIDYLRDITLPPCDAITHSATENKQSLAFFRGEISKLLNVTLKQGLYTKYGPSQKEDLNPVEQTLAIPYRANNTPNERSRFGNSLESINFTIQMLMIRGINKNLFVQQIKKWQTIAQQECHIFQLTNTEETPTARGFSLLVDGQYALSHIQLDDELQVNQIYATLRFNRALMFYLLDQVILPQICEEQALLVSDPFNHVSLYRSIQGLSATPFNYPTFPSRLVYDKTPSVGADSYVIQLIDQSPLSSVEGERGLSWISSCISRSSSRSRCRALIDINATFAGTANLEVAQQIATYVKAHPDHFSQEIKHILYFNDKQVLCAISPDKPNNPLLLKTSEPNELKTLLNAEPGERFTYYDQAHVQGVDLVQDKLAHALVLIDDTIYYSHLIQGVMRMRQLNQQQTVEFVIPHTLSPCSFKNLMQHIKNREHQALEEAITSAIRDAMRNIKHLYLDLIKKLPINEPLKKAELAQQWQSLLVINPSHELFTLYGRGLKKQQASLVIDQLTAKLLEEARTILGPYFDYLISMMRHELESIKAKMLSFCPVEIEEEDVLTSTEVETQKEVETEICVVTPSYKASNAVCWSKYDLTQFYLKEQLINQVSVPLNQICPNQGAYRNLFSPCLRASLSYAQTYVGQDQYLNQFLKPVFIVWYCYQDQRLQAMMVTVEDAEALKNHVEQEAGNWLATIEGTLIYGSCPTSMMQHEEYLALQEQVHFFNGYFASLLDTTKPKYWINQRSSEKIDFFTNHLLPYRASGNSKIEDLKLAYLTPDHLRTLYTHPQATAALGDKISSNPSFDPSWLKTLADSRQSRERFGHFSPPPTMDVAQSPSSPYTIFTSIV